MSDEKTFSVKLELLENYMFKVDFGDFGDIITDEPEPLGNSEGPNPGRLLAAAVANCLAASLMFAIRKFKEDPGQVRAEVSATMARIDGLWRIPKIHVQLELGNTAEAITHLPHVLEQFEKFCIVTQSVRNGIDVAVQVTDSSGKVVLGG